MDKKQVEVMLMFGTDAAKAEAELLKLQKRFSQLGQRAETLRKELDVFKATKQDSQALEKELSAVEQEMNAVSRAARNAQSEMKGMSRASQDIRDNLYNLRDIGQKISQVGTFVGNIGRSITNPLISAAGAAMQNDPYGETTLRWKSAQDEIEKSYLRIGAVAADTLLPAIEASAGLVKNIADFVEKNPELVKAALMLGGGLTVAGKGLETAGSLAMILGSLKNLGLFGGAAGTAAAGGSALAMGGTILGGVGLGLAAYEGIAQSEWGKKQGLANLGQYASVAAYGAGSLFGEDTANKWFKWMGEMTGVIEKQADAAEKNTKAQEPVTQAQLDAFAAWEDAQTKRKDFEKTSEEQRTEIVSDFASRRTEIEQSYEAQRNQLISQYAEQRAKAIADFSRSERRTEQDYYRQRQQAAARHGVDMQRMEQDHQREMLKMTRDHNRRARDLVDERDALGLVREQESYEDQRREAEDQYHIEASRKNQDYAEQMRDMESNFALQRQTRLEDFQRQLADMQKQNQDRLAQLDASHALEVQKLAEQEKARLEQYDKNYKDELKQLEAAEAARLSTLRALAFNDQSALQQAGMAMTARYRAWLQQASQVFGVSVSGSSGISRSGGVNGRRAEGGWVNSLSSYLVGERGPELFVPHNSGNIVPTHRILSNGGGTDRNSEGSVNMRIETGTLTLNQVITEIDKRLGRNNRALAGAF